MRLLTINRKKFAFLDATILSWPIFCVKIIKSEAKIAISSIFILLEELYINLIGKIPIKLNSHTGGKLLW